MTQKDAISEFLAVHAATRTVYDTVLAYLLKGSPVAATLREAFPALLEELQRTHGEDSLAYREAKSVINSLFRE